MQKKWGMCGKYADPTHRDPKISVLTRPYLFPWFFMIFCDFLWFFIDFPVSSHIPLPGGGTLNGGYPEGTNSEAVLKKWLQTLKPAPKAPKFFWGFCTQMFRKSLKKRLQTLKPSLKSGYKPWRIFHSEFVTAEFVPFRVSPPVLALVFLLQK